ncbi:MULTISPECIES: Rap1a/Tai family immunity protein [Sphingobium]|jgi:hypothetical protein|uniref:Rap1a immunity protein domain-containing protein n=2 Tax=Sphingobium fuliginis (strain ATCC 27551) TaxID=336203 RepID=A0A292ZM29_SPHSA|nr:MULTISPECIES: Rap1a/Tai family immunity protein [Sphingobium]MCB4860323.1 hypothetical protein [Sphingobium sp. PNB]UXC93401.1 Rap1a/Tai family immunity protein [Sphingobium sp. RSMS]GAY24168.1 hypothetical protein SFOMI_4748 [Sphingobium fuliginis]GFZ90148.1 hypothetical protein GCM10019071_20150 [Sphingobium fuliginis]
MMKSGKPAYLLLAVAAGTCSPAALAGFYTGEELYELCSTPRSSNDYLEKTYECIAYITGAVDAFNTTREVNKLKSCIPADVTISQLRNVTVDYLRDNPEERSASASRTVFAATRKVWPCPRTRKR